MNSEMLTAVLITLVGMGLVFATLLLLWGLIVLLVRFFTPKAVKSAPADETNLDELHQAAAVAVALALAEESEQTWHEFPLPPTALVTPWQAAMRTRMMNKRGSAR